LAAIHSPVRTEWRCANYNQPRAEFRHNYAVPGADCGAVVHIELLRPPGDLPSCARGRPLAHAISTSRPYRRPRRPEPASLPSSPPRRTPL
jgi:hypothetical protein